MEVLTLAFVGGLISATTTSLGSFLAPLFTKIEKLRKCHLSMDFALGVMLSAVAFSLVGPDILKGTNLSFTFTGLLSGMMFIFITQKIISTFQHKKVDAGKILLISALIFHNFPEGMGAGASLAGMSLEQAIPLQIAISIQNIAEGLLLTLLLQGMGLNLFWAVTGGIASGILEMSGALGAGFLLEQTQEYLPFLLSLAGGAMMMSVLLEVVESHSAGKKLQRSHFAWGLATIPISNIIFS
jgi:zinc transporter ZupT